MHTSLIVAPAEAERLRRMTEALLAGCLLPPDAAVAAGVNRTGYTLLTPGVNTAGRSVYPGFWTRDPAWLAETGLIPADIVWGWVELLCGTMNGPTARAMTTGAVVPPFALFDHITLDGRLIYFPGSEGKPDDAQGGPQMLTGHDNQYWLTFTASAYARLSGRRDVGARPVRTALGALPLWLACDLAHHALAVDAATGCCLIRDDRPQADWGYSESAHKSGLAVFPTLLRIESCGKLAALLDGCGQEGRASALRAEEQQLRRSVVEQFVSEGGGQTWLLSATGEGRVPDAWASAFAVHRGFLPPDVAAAVARTLADGIRRRTTIVDGQVIHVPADRGGVWPRSLFTPGKYQNGAGWGYPAGWYVSAAAQADPEAARQLFVEYLAAMERNWRDDGVGCAWECVNPALNHFQNEGYLTTVALPYVALCEAGLIPPRPVAAGRPEESFASGDAHSTLSGGDLPGNHRLR